MDLLGNLCDGFLSGFLRDLCFLFDCVAGFVFIFLLQRLISVWIWIFWVIYEVMGASCTVMMYIFRVICRVHQ